MSISTGERGRSRRTWRRRAAARALALASAVLLAATGCADPDDPPGANGTALALGGVNLGFEVVGQKGLPRGWPAPSSLPHEYVRDTSEPHAGRASARLRWTEGVPESAASSVMQCTDAMLARSRGVRFAGMIKTDGVERRAALVLHMTNPSSPMPLSTHELPVRGSVDWTELTVDVRLPDEVDRVCFGFVLAGPGTAWIDELALTVS